MASPSVQLSDQYLVEDSMNHDNYDKISTDKQMLYAIDQANNSYNNGIVVIDTTNQMGGNQGFCATSDGYVIAPYPVSMFNTGALNGAAGTTALANAFNPFSLALKANVANVIDRIDLTINGTSVCAGQSYTNLWSNTRVQCEYSTSELTKSAGTNLIYPDDTWSINYSENSSGNGDGYTNNCALASTSNVFTTTTPPYSYNSGHFKRCMEAAASGGSSNGFGWASQATNSTQNHINNGESYFLQSGTGTSHGVANAAVWYYMLKIKLSDLHPIFKSLDLCKNPQIRLTIYYNVGQSVINLRGASAGTIDLYNSVSSGGNTCPVMVSSFGTGQPNVGLQPATTSTSSLQLNWGVVNNSAPITGGSNFAFATTRLYLPFYNLIPSIERKFLENPTKKVVFNDVFIQQFKNAATSNGSTFTLAIQSTLPNIQYICLIPFANSSNNFLAANCEQFMSPLDSAPFTTLPGCGLYNVQVQLGSQTIYKNLMSYDWQNFCDEISNLSAVNGDQTSFMGNGLIDQIKWATGYKKWIFDVSRQSSDVRQNVNISGQLQSDQATTFYVLIVYRKSFDQNRITGEITNLRGC